MSHLYCINCSQEWDIDYVLNQAPEQFVREGAMIQVCPACNGKKVALSEQEQHVCNLARMLAEQFGSDVYAAAETMEHLDSMM